MGIDISATVFYGFPIEIPEEWWEEDDGEDGWMSMYCRKSGLDENDFSVRWNLPIRVSHGCAEDCEKYYACINDAGFGSDWGEITELDLIIKPEWDEQFKDWCEKVNVPYQQPKWYLTCNLST